MDEKLLYRVIYYDKDKIYEIYANIINDSSIYGFIEVSEIIFESDSTIIDPAEERLKDEFKNVKTTYIPQQSIIRIDYISKKGTAKIQESSKQDSNIKPINKNILTLT